MSGIPDGQQSVCVRMPADLHAEAVERAKLEERSLNQLIRYVCRLYVENRLPR
jgi:predicted HicB family RNase H-like nuclease